jgi:ribosomal protein L37E
MDIPEEALKILQGPSRPGERFAQTVEHMINQYALPPSIECPRCHRVSFHPQDVSEGYCAHCHDFTTPNKLHQPIELQGER